MHTSEFAQQILFEIEEVERERELLQRTPVREGMEEIHEIAIGQKTTQLHMLRTRLSLGEHDSRVRAIEGWIAKQKWLNKQAIIAVFSAAASLSAALWSWIFMKR